MAKILPYLLGGISVGGQYALIAIGYTMVYGILRLINFAHGDIFTVAGFIMSPEGRRVFADLTVLENLKIGAYLRRDKAEIEKDLQWVYTLFPRLQERSWQLAGTLSGGEQQMLAVGRALMRIPVRENARYFPYRLRNRYTPE